MLAATASPALAAEALPADGPAYQVDQVFIDFAEDLPVHPPTKLMMQLPVELGVTDTGYVSPREGLATKTVRIMDVPKLDMERMHASAIRAVGNVIVEHFREWGYAGITVTPHPEDIAPDSGKDVRLEGQTALRLIVRSMTGRGRPMKVGPIWETPDERDGKPYRVDQFIIEVADGVEAAIDPAQYVKTAVVLAESEQGLFSARSGSKQIQVRLVDVPKLDSHVFYQSALYDVSEALTDALHRAGHENIYAAPHPKDIDPQTDKDIRFANQTALRLLIREGQLPDRPQVVEAAPEQAEQAERVEVAAADLPEAEEADGVRYPVGQVIIEYDDDHPDLPDLSKVMDTPVTFTEVVDGYVAPRPEAPSNRTLRVAELPTLDKQAMYGSAIRHLNQELVAAFNDMGYIGIYVAPHPQDINQQGEDVRPETQTALRTLVQSGVVSDIRTIAAGDRIPLEDRIDHPKHERVRDLSPVKPGGEGESTDLLRRDQLDRYVYWLNRHPGRRADVAVAPGEAPGTIALDLLVTESKPWMVYAQLSNTGTEQTSEWRERFGFIHNQLTNNDDILAIDYITADFDSAHTVIGSYEAPLFGAKRLRWTVEGNYSEFTASDVGFADQQFEGESWSAGGGLIWNFWQKDEAFLDLTAGARWQHVEVNDETINQEGDDDFFLPYVGLRYERIQQTQTSLGELQFEWNVPGVAGTEADELEKLGRLDADEDGMRLTWSLVHSFYLEPLLWRQAWEDPETWRSSTLAHEIWLNFRGQYSFDTRLNPQRQRTVGGLYSVRGYEESLVAGDDAYIFTAEYRFHLPRIFAPSQDPGSLLWDQSFRWRPQYVYQRPDWDLVFRGFFDYAQTDHSDVDDVSVFEEDQSLMAAGAGVELQIKRNLSLRLDWGYVLEDVEQFGTVRASEGDNRFHFVGTILY